MNNSNMPAMPQSLAMSDDGRMYGTHEHDGTAGGLTKLEHFAGLAMQGILAREGNKVQADEVAFASFVYAKALLKQLEGESNE